MSALPPPPFPTWLASPPPPPLVPAAPPDPGAAGDAGEQPTGVLLRAGAAPDDGLPRAVGHVAVQPTLFAPCPFPDCRRAHAAPLAPSAWPERAGVYHVPLRCAGRPFVAEADAAAVRRALAACDALLGA